MDSGIEKDGQYLMDLDYSLLTIDSAIAHQLPKRPGDGSQPTFQLSRKESPLSQTVKNDLKKRITRSFSLKRLEVMFDTEAQSPVSGLIRDFFNLNTCDLVGLSCELTRRLHTVDPQRSAGYLALIAATYEKKPCLLITKLDSGSNINFVWEEQSDGTGFYRFEQIDGMPQYTRVFKAALFMEGLETGSSYGIVSDNQTRGVADFFLKGFLGCKPREESAITTENVFNHIVKWVGANVEDTAVQGKYISGIMAEMSSNDPQFQPEACLQKHMNPADSDRARTALRTAGLPVEGFDKDIARIETKLQNIEWRFEKVRLIAPADAEATGLLQMQKTEDGKVSVKFEDRLDTAKVRR